MTRYKSLGGIGLLVGSLALVSSLFNIGAISTQASSHREAPMISQDPEADNLDLYAFVSPDKPDTISLIATFIPFEGPAGGPNFYRFGDEAYRYAVNPLPEAFRGEVNAILRADREP